MAFVIMVTPPAQSERRIGLLHIDGICAVWGDDRREQAEREAEESQARYPNGWQFTVMFEGDAFRAMGSATQ